MKQPIFQSTTLDAFGDADYKAFEARAQSKYGIRLIDYKTEQMQRRLATLAKRHGANSFADFLAKLDRDATLLQSFLDEVTINVTELLRNPDLFEYLEKKVLPGMRGANKMAPLSVWSAGSSYGAEAYSVAMLLHELDGVAPWKVRGTDVDLTVVTRANSANFCEADMKNVSTERRKIHFQQIVEGRFSPKLHLKRNVSFAGHDLLGTDYPKDSYDLICCRNVVIYFTDAAKERIFRGFYKSLKPGGILFVGGSERLPSHEKIGYEIVSPFFYRKPLKDFTFNKPKVKV